MMAHLLNPFVRCECGKVHTRLYVTQTTLCACGRNLWALVWR